MFPTVMGMMMNKMNYYAQLNCYINEFTSCHLDYYFADIFLESQRASCIVITINKSNVDSFVKFSNAGMSVLSRNIALPMKYHFIPVQGKSNV